jgi:hypothetical protein
MHHIVCAFRLVEAQNNYASIRKPLAMGHTRKHMRFLPLFRLQLQQALISKAGVGIAG